MVSRCHVKPTEINKNNQLPIWAFDNTDSLTKGLVFGSSFIIYSYYDGQKFTSNHSAEPQCSKKNNASENVKSGRSKEKDKSSNPVTTQSDPVFGVSEELLTHLLR